MEKVNNAYVFKEQCQRSDDALRKSLCTAVNADDDEKINNFNEVERDIEEPDIIKPHKRERRKGCQRLSK